MLLALSMHAQQWEVFNMANSGLPSNRVTALVQDAQGIIWAGTDWGLCRYDGQSWTVVQEAYGELPSNSISCLAVDSLDRLWIGTDDSGIGILDNGAWSVVNADNSPVQAAGIKHIHHDHRGWVWISTELGLISYANDLWRVYDNSPQSYNGFTLFGPNIKAVDVNADGLVAVATLNGGLTYITETEYIFYTSANSNFPDNSANAIAFDSSGDRWLACPAGGLIRHAGDFIGGPWFQYNGFTTGIPDNTLTSLVIDAADRKLAGSETAGVLVFAGPAAWTTWNAANTGLPDDHVLSLMLDSSGKLWVGTAGGGVARTDPTVGIPKTASTGVLVYPNPFAGRLAVDLSSTQGPVSWTLVDLAGRTAAQGVAPGGGLAWLEPRLARGSYVLHLASGQGGGVVRVVAE